MADEEDPSRSSHEPPTDADALSTSALGRNRIDTRVHNVGYHPDIKVFKMS